MKRLIFTLLFTLLISIAIITTINHTKATKHQTSQKANTTQLETYEYIITEIDESGLYGDSLNDDTGIYIDQSTIKGMNLTEGNKIAVQFPKDDFETITSVTKIK